MWSFVGIFPLAFNLCELLSLTLSQTHTQAHIVPNTHTHCLPTLIQTYDVVGNLVQMFIVSTQFRVHMSNKVGNLDEN